MKPQGILNKKIMTIHKNRFIFHQTVNEKIALAKRQNHIVCLLLIDLDNFQSINSHFGHSLGDNVLLETHKRLASCLSSNDYIAHVNGAEFVILLGDIIEPKAAENALSQLKNCFNTIFKLDGMATRVNASMGVAYYPHAGVDSQSLLQSATISMFHAKELGGNNCQIFTKTLSKKHKKKSYLENALKFALDKNELFVMYQPIFNLSTKELVGIEALLRWRHLPNSLIPPDIFIELAEKNGLLPSIGKWALQTVCEQAKQWYLAGHNRIKISFNISSSQLLLNAFPKFMMQAFKNTKIPPHLFDLELTETAFVSNPIQVENILKKMSKSGINIIIDDFGTGHSSLTRLKNLPIKALKIDKSFVLGITPDSFDAIIVHSLITLGEQLGLNVIAEGIESKKELDFLIANGCPQGQGYYLCRPLNVKQMTSFLKKYKK